MNKPPEHVVRLLKKNRGPILDAHWLPTCEVCGPLADPTDIEQARTHRNRHEGQIKRGEV